MPPPRPRLARPVPALATEVCVVLIVAASEPAVVVATASVTLPVAPAARLVRPEAVIWALVELAATVRASW